MRALICLGAVAPAALTYARLHQALRDEAHLLLMDPVCFAPAVPHDYGLQREIEAVVRAADAAGCATFDLIGYSVSASLALLLAMRHPDRLGSLVLIEPPWIGTAPGPAADIAVVSALDRAMAVPPAVRYRALLRAVSPADGDRSAHVPIDPPSWLIERPVRFGLLWHALRAETIALQALSSFSRPVYLPVGSRTHPWFLQAARWLAAHLPCAVVEIYPGLTHLDPPQTREPERFAAALRRLWSRSSLRD